MVEQHIQTNITDSLVPGLDFRGGVPSAEYVKSSKLVRWRAEAGDRFSQAAKQLRFRLVDDCWLQSGTVRLQVTINNNSGANPLQPVADPLAMFASARLYMGGQLVEDIQELGVVAVMLDYFKPVNRRINDSMMNHPWLKTPMTARPCATAMAESSSLSSRSEYSSSACGCPCTSRPSWSLSSRWGLRRSLCQAAPTPATTLTSRT